MEQQNTVPPSPARVGLEKLLRQRWILLAGALGVALLLALGFWEEQTPATTQPPALQAQDLDVRAYEQGLEERLQGLLAQVEGAGQVTVMVMLENTAQTVYAQAYAQTSDAPATWPEGGSQRTSTSNSYVLVEEGGSRQALAETTLQPTVKGVAVVCTGADDVGVVSRITELVSTVLGIPSNRICVTK